MRFVARRLTASLLTLWLLLSPTGFVGAAIQSTGSALAAERDLTLKTTGDVQLLAAVSQRIENHQRTDQSS